jgi:hypothetical protein
LNYINFGASRHSRRIFSKSKARYCTASAPVAQPDRATDF